MGLTRTVHIRHIYGLHGTENAVKMCELTRTVHMRHIWYSLHTKRELARSSAHSCTAFNVTYIVMHNESTHQNRKRKLACSSAHSCTPFSVMYIVMHDESTHLNRKHKLARSSAHSLVWRSM